MEAAIYRRGYTGAALASPSPSVSEPGVHQAATPLSPQRGILPNQPTVPSSTTVTINPYQIPVVVYLSGGTVTVVAVNGTTTGLTTPATVIVPAGGTVTVTYSIAPTWVWMGFS